MINMAILASGEGTNAENLIIFSKNNAEDFNIQCVLTNNSKARVIQRCLSHKIPVHVVPRPKTMDRIQHEKEMVHTLKDYAVDLICLAGFDRILGRTFLQHFKAILNIHPAYLPEFPGLNAYQRAFHSKQEYSGVTVHYVDEGMDTGKIILQEKFYRDKTDTLETFENKGRLLEKKLYPKALLVLREKMTCRL